MAESNGYKPPPFALDEPGIALSTIAIGITGPPGSGKTHLLGTMSGRGFVLNILPGERGAPVILAHLRDRIMVKSITEWSEIGPIYEWLKQGKSVTGLDWIALDSFTALTETADRRVLKERLSKGIMADPALRTKQDWGQLSGFLHNFLTDWLALPYLKFIVVQERRYEDDELGSTFGPDTRPPVLGFFCQSLSGLGRIYKAPIAPGREEWRFRVGQHPNYYTKWQVRADRLERWPSIIRSPNLTNIIGYVYGADGKFPPPDAVDEAAEAPQLTQLS